MQLTKSFLMMADRYQFDAKYTSAAGWMQFDTDSDASYFGNWINPTTLEAFSFVEGDCYKYKMDNKADFVAEIKRWIEWYGVEFRGIDCKFAKELYLSLPAELSEHAH